MANNTSLNKPHLKKNTDILTGQQMMLIALMAAGSLRREDICKTVGITEVTYDRWRKIPRVVEEVKARQKSLMADIDVEELTRGKKKHIPVDDKIRSRALRDFEFFRKEFLGRKTIKCQKRWAKWIMDEDRTVVLCPRKHGKTYTVRDYVIWRIVQDRNIRVLVISKNERNARRWIKSIKAVLAGNKKLIEYFGVFQPPGKPEKWTQSELIVEGADPTMEDPTLVSLGMTAAMDGLRADLVVVDDPVDVASSDSEDQREKSEEIILGSVDNILDNTLGREPKMVVIGTRKHVLDVYKKLMDTEGFNVHVEKAVLSWGDAGDSWRGKILCPELYNNTRIAGVLYKEGIAFFRAQRKKGEKRFNREFQNAAFDDTDVIVPSDAFDDDKNKDFIRTYGAKLPHWYVVVAADPGVTLKTKGSFAASVIGFDQNEPGKRYLIDYFEGVMPSEDQPRFLCSWYFEYGAAAMAIESNACQKYLMDSVLREGTLGGSYRGSLFPSMSINVKPHFTSFTKLNHPVAGLETVGRYFEKGLWSLPAITERDEAKTAELIENICGKTYREHQKAHLLMTFWFAENQILDLQTQTLQVIKLDVPAWRETEELWYDIRR